MQDMAAAPAGAPASLQGTGCSCCQLIAVAVICFIKHTAQPTVFKSCISVIGKLMHDDKFLSR